MKKRLIKIISVVLTAALLFATVPATVFAQNTDSGELDIGVVSDLHYYAHSNVDDMTVFGEVSEKTMSASHLAHDILLTALDFYKVKAEKGELDYLFVPGDLTKNGDLANHTELAAILENWEEVTGVPVLVANGNHDINNSSAQAFKNGVYTSEGAEITTPEQFRELYKNLGYDLAVAEFTPPSGEKAGMLSYVAQLDNGYRVVIMDGGIYSADATPEGVDEHETSGKFSDAALEWILEQVTSSTEKGYSVIGMTHWNIVSHLGYKEHAAFTAFLIEDSQYVAELLADAGMKYVFTGHMHIHDISQLVSDNGNIIHDIATSSLINFPNLIRTVKFDNTQDGVIKADIKSHDFDELKPLTWNGKTFEQPFSNYAFGINFVGDSAKEMVMELAGYYVESFIPQIKAAGGLYNFLNDMLGLEGLIDGLFDDLLGGGIGFAGITILGTKNAMGLIKDLCRQIDKAYVEHPEELMGLASDLLDGLLEIKVSDIPCTKFLDTYGFGDASKGGTFGDMISSVLVYMYVPGADMSDDAFVMDVMGKLETGEISTKVFDALLEHLVNGFLLDGLLGTLQLNLASAFPFGTIGHILVTAIDTILTVVLWGNKSFTNIANTVIGLLGAFGVLEGSDINSLLDHYINEYLTTSQFETIDGELKTFINDFCVDDNSEDCNIVLTANLNGGYEVEKTADNMRLPSNVAVTFGDDAASTRNISWITKKSVTGSDVQISLDAAALSDELPEGVKVTTTSETVQRMNYGIDIGIAGILKYFFDVNRHTAKIEGLEPDTTYYYRIGDAAKGYWSPVGTITTADNSDSFTFFHMSDSQSGMERQYKVWANVVDTAFTMYPESAFILHTGDHVDHGDNFHHWKWLFNTAAPNLMNTAYMPTAGNHEEHGTFAIQTNFLLPSHPEQDEETGTYYSFEYNNALFMVLNANSLNEDEGFSDEQIEWMKATAAASEADWKFVTTHKAVYSNGSHYDDDDVIEMRAQLSTLMPELGVDMVFQGHDHVYLRTDAMNNNEVVEVYEMSVDNSGKTYTAKVNPDGTVYVIDACSGVKYYQTKDAADTDELFPRAQAIVDATYPVFAAVRIEGNSLYFDSYGVTDEGTECIDSFAIVKDASIETPKYEQGGKCPLNKLFAA
ncbi:MAG: metallophosphoesterase [Clostridia bacterium]|nr:metallophosphoesterase [Clostridia bacterium]